MFQFLVSHIIVVTKQSNMQQELQPYCRIPASFAEKNSAS